MTKEQPNGGVRVSSRLQRTSHFFETDNQMNVKGIIETTGVATPQDRLKEKYERIKRIREARENNTFKPYKLEE